MRRTVQALLSALILVALTVAAGADAGGGLGLSSLTITPPIAQPGDVVQVTGANFPKHGRGTFVLGGAALAEFHVRGNGDVVEHILIPEIIAAGTYLVQAVVDGEEVTAAPIIVTAEVATPPPATATPMPTPAPTPMTGSAVLVGAGDIAACASGGDEATAALLDDIAGTVFTTGDNVYDNGSASEFTSCYDPSWGRHRARTRPAPGNHDWYTANAQGYRDYFSLGSGPLWYSYNVGAWHVVVLDSNCANVGGCDPGSSQHSWLVNDLAADDSACTLALWHHPRFSSGHHGSSPATAAFWTALYNDGAELVITGHDHLYERFAPQSPSGSADPNGIRQFVVGTGGRDLYEFTTVVANSEVRNNDTFGVLKLTLDNASYTWQFVPQAGRTFTDSGTGICH